MNTQEIRKLLEQDKLIIGYNEVRQAVEDQSCSQVLIAANAREDQAEALRDYCAMSDVGCETLEVRNDQVGTTCRKPFSISYLAVRT